MKILEFMFQSFWHFFGCLVLIFLTVNFFENILIVINNKIKLSKHRHQNNKTNKSVYQPNIDKTTNPPKKD